MHNITTFDYITAHVVFFFMIFYVYKETPFRNDIDNISRIYFDAFCEKLKLLFETVSGMNAFLLLDYEDYDSRFSEIGNETVDIKEKASIPQEKKEEKYEDKYLERFKSFPNDYFFTEEETVSIEMKSDTMRVKIENDFRANMERVLEIIYIMNLINKKGIETEAGIKELLNFYNLDYEEYKIDPEYFENCDADFTKLEQLYDKFLDEKHQYEVEFEELKNHTIDMEKINKEAKECILKTKLDSLKNCYVMECTPLGNVVMRYDNNRGTFEYFSNNTIPYRYLEPVGRKYVMTYFCKPLFVDLEEELRKAEEKYEIEKDNQKREQEEQTKRYEPKQIFANLKSYNTPLLKSTPLNLPSKNREPARLVLPPQIKANLPNVNTKTDKHILKENANRYTWEGRFSNLNLLKKIDRKQIDKKYAMTFADFKRMQTK